jgi:hypothetical protein
MFGKPGNGIDGGVVGAIAAGYFGGGDGWRGNRGATVFDGGGGGGGGGGGCA